MALAGKAIERHATADGTNLGAPDLARRLSLLRLLRFKFLTAFLVSGLSVLGAGLFALSRPHSGSIEFDNGNSARIDRGPIVKTI